SKPRESRRGCSRVSPHLAWGNLSVRQVFQRSRDLEVPGSKRNLKAFQDRLRWQSHFMQKFESEIEYEQVPINRGFIAVDATKKMDHEKFTAWKMGRTGVPLVDACMRCLDATGYLNFRMRAMVVSFYSQYLWLPWKPGADYLASLFTDFEPGIHYPQFQMQSGYTGVNTIRIYNPIKQSQDHDPKGIFIKEWIPELAQVPEEYIHEPWNIPPLQLAMENISFGDYPAEPIIDLSKARKHASDTLYAAKKSKSAAVESKRILARHTNPGRRER
ncbi:MAG: FAD-binding domain-containing protein, partial [Schleiferiaceae bacterium]